MVYWLARRVLKSKYFKDKEFVDAYLGEPKLYMAVYMGS